MRLTNSLAGLLLLTACSAPPSQQQPPAAQRERKPAVETPADEAARFPKQDLDTVRIITKPLLGRSFLPGGNIGYYVGRNKRWELYLAKAKNDQQAGIWLLDLKGTLKDPQFVAHMGGYAGVDPESNQPLYTFAKGPWLVAVAGLPQQEADLRAREFALRLR